MLFEEIKGLQIGLQDEVVTVGLVWGFKINPYPANVENMVSS